MIVHALLKTAAIGTTVATAATLALLGPTTATGAAPAPGSQVQTKLRVVDDCLTSVPDPGSTAAVKICYTLFRPSVPRAGTRCR